MTLTPEHSNPTTKRDELIFLPDGQSLSHIDNLGKLSFIGRLNLVALKEYWRKISLDQKGEQLKQTKRKILCLNWHLLWTRKEKPLFPFLRDQNYFEVDEGVAFFDTNNQMREGIIHSKDEDSVTISTTDTETPELIIWNLKSALIIKMWERCYLTHDGWYAICAWEPFCKKYEERPEKINLFHNAMTKRFLHFAGMMHGNQRKDPHDLRNDDLADLI
ncbi:MAG: hypothetical protein WCO23_04910 [bacterium]